MGAAANASPKSAPRVQTFSNGHGAASAPDRLLRFFALMFERKIVLLLRELEPSRSGLLQVCLRDRVFRAGCYFPTPARISAEFFGF
jgi:hypothetical protein